MQAAVDCSGSSSSKTTTLSNTITTITTLNKNECESTAMTQQLQQQQKQQHVQNHYQHHEQQYDQPNSLQQQPLPTTEIQNILRQRAVNAAINSGEGTAQPHKNVSSHHIDATAEYLGTHVVECMFVPHSPQATPAKSSNCSDSSNKCNNSGEDSDRDTTTTACLLHNTNKSNTSSESSSSKTASNSTSTTSSVIATPILKRNDKINTDQLSVVSNEDNAVVVADDGKNIQQENEKHQQIGECSNKQLLTNQMLPNDNHTSTTATAISAITTTAPAATIDIKQKLSTLGSLNPMSSSSTTTTTTTTSLSIITPTVAVLPSTPSPSPSSASSSSSSTTAMSSSSASTTTSTTPASATTTPALLSTPTSLSPSASSSFSSSAGSSPASSVASQSPTEAKGKDVSISGLVQAELLQWQDMPEYLQFNPYVLKGYRPLQTFQGCLLSMFCWHNETINILTHAIPILCILATVPGQMPWDRGYRFLSFCHVFGSLAPWCGSFIYHLFMNIEKGEIIYYRLLKLDMVGIWVSQSFGALPLVTATTFCFSYKWKFLIISSYCLFSLWGLYKALTASSPWERRLCFALPFTMRSILTVFRTIGLVGGNRVALEHVYLQDVVSILGGAIGAMRIPEKWFPGVVDFYLNSHNIMHVLVVVAVYSMHKATVKDFEWMESANCDAFTNVTNKVLETTLNAKIEL